MADCSKTVDFFKERDRMCDSFECEDCPIYCDNNGKREHCEEFCAKYADEAVQILQAWSDSHPATKPKTYADVFLEKFPKQHIEHTNQNGGGGYAEQKYSAAFVSMAAVKNAGTNRSSQRTQDHADCFLADLHARLGSG